MDWNAESAICHARMSLCEKVRTGEYIRTKYPDYSFAAFLVIQSTWSCSNLSLVHLVSQ